MATVTVLAEQSRGSLGPQASHAIPGGAARPFIVNILSADWQTIGDGVHQLDIAIERSLDSGTTWSAVAAATLQSGPVKGGGLPGFQASWDGQACLARIGHVTTTVSGVDDVAFGWGLSVTV